MAIYSLREECLWCSCDIDLTVKGVLELYMAIIERKDEGVC